MNSYQIVLDFHVQGDGDIAAFDHQLDDVLDALYEDPTVTDPDYVAVLDKGEVAFSLTTNHFSLDEALQHARKAIRTAIHTAQSIPGAWDSNFEETELSVTQTVAVHV